MHHCMCQIVVRCSGTWCVDQGVCVGRKRLDTWIHLHMHAPISNHRSLAWQTALFTLLPNARLLQWATLGGPGSSVSTLNFVFRTSVSRCGWLKIIPLTGTLTNILQGQGSVDLVGCRAQIMSAGIANKLNVNPLTAPLQCAQVLKIYDDTMSLIRLLGLFFALGDSVRA